jgi:VanZ family protein
VLANTAFVFGVVLLIILSFAPAQGLPSSQLNDKWGHFIAYTMLVFAFGTGSKNWQRCVVGAFGIFVMGVALEGLQGFVSGRDPSIFDVAANTAGVLNGFCAALLSELLVQRLVKR